MFESNFVWFKFQFSNGQMIKFINPISCIEKYKDVDVIIPINLLG